MDHPLFATLTEIRAWFSSRKLSSVELTRMALDRLDSLGARLNAVASVLRDRAIIEARAADKLFKRARRLGPLTGIPYGAKDLLAVSGAPTTYGAPPYAQQVLPYDASVIESLRRAGAVLVAKLALVELAGGGGFRYPSASLQGPCRNPWNVDFWTGGSSSGTAAAVAAGLVPYGIGSETGGSILIPSSNCGVTGLRPTYGLVSRHGAMALSWSLDKLGPMCRSAEDCGLVLQAMAGPDQRDQSCVGRRFQYGKRAILEPRGLRVGYAVEDFDAAVPSVRGALREVLPAFRTLGVRFVRAVLPPLPIDAAIRIIIRAEGSAAFKDLIQSPRLAKLVDRRQQIGLRAGLEIHAVDYINALRVRRLVQDAFAELFSKVDVILAPAYDRPAHRIDEPLDPEWRPVVLQARKSIKGTVPRGNGAITAGGNLAGLPALCLPCGFSTTGLPIGVQLVGRPFEEASLIDLGQSYQRITDWHRRIPPECA